MTKPRVWLHLVLAMCLSLSAHAQDVRTAQMEQDIRELKQEVLRLTRRVESLESQANSSAAALGATGSTPTRAVKRGDEQSQWLNMSNWDRIRVGANERDVLQTLGPPTALRKSDDGSQQTLVYALEIGTGSFLIGSITLQAARVVEVSKPSLR